MRTPRIVLLALVVGIFFVGQEILVGLAEGQPANLAPRIVVMLCFWVAWALLTPVVRAVVRRWPLDAGPMLRPLVAHAVVAVPLVAVHSALSLVLQSAVQYLRGGITIQHALANHARPVPFVWGMISDVAFYSVVLMVYTAAALKAELTQVKLDTLRSQLRPHFLFNTLNAISVFVAEDAGKAQQMLLRLSTLLRRSLDEEAHEVSLRHELAFVNDYLDIQRGRFGDDLIIELAIDPAVLDAHVPVFLLQPLLENAIEHGKSDGKPTTVTLRASRSNDTLHMTLEDDGPGIHASVREGIGLRNTRARLAHLYGPRASVELGPADPGARVDIRIPYQ